MPLILFPFVLSTFSDALVALGRISKFLTAEELAEPYAIDYEMKNAVMVDGDFTWEATGKLEESRFEINGQGGGNGRKGGGVEAARRTSWNRRKHEKNKEGAVLPTVLPVVQDEEHAKEKEERPFELKNLRLSVPKGAFVAIVGRVGSGKVLLILFF